MGDEYIPLEANLWNDVSFKKGCYTGQEIIARMESRQKVGQASGGLYVLTSKSCSRRRCGLIIMRRAS